MNSKMIVILYEGVSRPIELVEKQFIKKLEKTREIIPLGKDDEGKYNIYRDGLCMSLYAVA